MIHLLQPPRAPSFISGGYRYNDELGQRLAATGLGRLTEVPLEALAGARAPSWIADDGEAAVFVLDSLFLGLWPVPGWLAETNLRARARLLMHYLPSSAPGLDAIERGRRLERERAWLQAVGGVLCTSDRMAAELREVHDLYAHVATPGVSSCFRPGRAASTPSNVGERARDHLTIVSVGTLLPLKGQLETARILASLAARELGQRDLRLTLIGEDGLDPEHVAAIRAAAQGIELELTGCLPAEDVAARLRDADLFVSASVFESYGMAVAEAAASGCPILARGVGEVERWVVEGENGHVIPADDPDAFSSALERLVMEPTHLDRMRSTPSQLYFPSWEFTFRSFIDACRAGGSLATNGRTEVTPYSSCDLPTRYGTFDVSVYRLEEGEEAILIRLGDLARGEPPFVRVHSECFTGEILHSLKCDCRNQLEVALSEVARRGRGAIVYLRQEGRGIGLGNKIRAYHEQSKGADTIEANNRLGFPADLRDFHSAASILRHNGLSRIELNTNNPDKVASLESHGIRVVRVVPSTTDPNPHNVEYLRTKYRSLGHVGLEEALRGSQVSGDSGASRRAGERIVLMDLDGVIQLDDGVPREARELLERLREGGHAVRFLTNDGINSRASRLEELKRGGLEVPPEELYTASYLAARLVRERGLEPVLVLCGAPALEEFDGVATVAPESDEARSARAVVVGDYFQHYDYGVLKNAFAALQDGAELVAMHRKPTWPTGGRREIDIGFWVAGFEFCSQRPAELAGKPAESSYLTVLRDAGFSPAEAVMVSDEDDPDLAGARRLGIRTVLFSEAAPRPYDALWSELRWLQSVP